jgi:hypothetical protein
MAFMRNPLYILMQDDVVQIHGVKQNLVTTQEIFDMIVMMRYYNMTEVERRDAIGLVVDSQFETGADGVRKASGLMTSMERVDAYLERTQTAGFGGTR